MVVEVQPPALAVMVNVVVTKTWGDVLFRVPVMGFEVPEAAMPVRMAVLSRVHEKVVPGILFGLVITMGVIGLNGQRVCANGFAATVGIEHPLITTTSSIKLKASLVTLPLPWVGVFEAISHLIYNEGWLLQGAGSGVTGRESHWFPVRMSKLPKVVPWV